MIFQSGRSYRMRVNLYRKRGILQCKNRTKNNVGERFNVNVLQRVIMLGCPIRFCKRDRQGDQKKAKWVHLEKMENKR